MILTVTTHQGTKTTTVETYDPQLIASQINDGKAIVIVIGDLVLSRNSILSVEPADEPSTTEPATV